MDNAFAPPVSINLLTLTELSLACPVTPPALPAHYSLLNAPTVMLPPIVSSVTTYRATWSATA